MKRLLVLLVTMASVMCGDVIAKDKKKSRTLEFEEGLVEGMNMNGSNFAGLTQKRRKDHKDHLYSRHLNFDLERRESLQSARYSQ